ncbi:MAG TPA: hypothetical protein PK733_02465 [Clostridiales bacterium]|nr:hypothetical protein [Clostridiales bacterium]
MNYRELLELTKKSPNPFSINGRKTRLYDYEVRNKIPENSKKKNEVYKRDRRS